MRSVRLRAASMLTASIIAYGADSAFANPLTPFRYEFAGATTLPCRCGGLARSWQGNLLLEAATTVWPRLYRKFCVPGASPQQRLSPLAARAPVAPGELQQDCSVLNAVAA